jgi:[protein-PII] uridylyltransferase
MDMLKAHTDLIDALFKTLWHDLQLDEDPNLSLYATGGYARNELFIYSDVDILILYPETLSQKSQDKISALITALWDAKIKVSHFVGSYTLLQEAISHDLNRYTNLLELRLIAGKALADTFYQSLIAQISIDDFYTRKLADSAIRHKNYGETSYALEPNLKESPGGLRDIHVLN